MKTTPRIVIALLAASALMWVTGSLQSVAQTQSLPAPVVDRVGFPFGYRNTFKRFYVFDNFQNRQIRAVWGNSVAASVPPGQTFNFPYGSILLFESYTVRQDASGEPLLDGNGRFIPDVLNTIFVMRKERGFGADYKELRTGEWEYVAYRPDGSYATPPSGTGSCAQCHLTGGALSQSPPFGAQWDFVFRPDLYFGGGSGAVPKGVLQHYVFVPSTIHARPGEIITVYNSDQILHRIVADELRHGHHGAGQQLQCESGQSGHGHVLPLHAPLAHEGAGRRGWCGAWSTTDGSERSADDFESRADISPEARDTAMTRIAGRLFVVALVLIVRDVDAQQRSPGGSSTLLSANTGSGARALGMGGAFIAIADDATAASWNPAGLARLDRRQLSFVGDLTRIGESIPSYESTKVFATGLRVVESGPAISVTRKSQSPEFASITYPVEIGRWTVVPQFSYRRAVKADFAQTTTQPYQYSESTGFRETGSDVRTFDGGNGIDVYAGAVGISLTRMLDIGAAINVWRGDSAGSDSRAITASFSLGGANGSLNPSSYRTTYSESFNGTSVDVGLLLRPVRRMRVGAIVKNGFNLTRTYGYERQYTNWIGSITSQTYGETGTIDWPRSVGVGVAVTPFEAFTVSTDYTHSSWSKADYRFTSSDVQVINGRSTTIESTGTVIYPDMYNPSAAVQPFFNVPQVDSSQLRGGAEVIWRRSDSGAFAGIPLRAGLYRNRSLLPQSNGSERVGTGVTAGTGVRWGRVNVDVAYLRESIGGNTREFPMIQLSGFSQSQQQDGRETTVLNRFLFSVEATF